MKQFAIIHCCYPNGYKYKNHAQKFMLPKKQEIRRQKLSGKIAYLPMKNPGLLMGLIIGNLKTDIVYLIIFNHLFNQFHLGKNLADQI